MCHSQRELAEHILKFDLASCYFSAIPLAKFVTSLIQKYSPFHMLYKDTS